MDEVDHAVGPEKADAESRAVDLILKLWTHRRALPEPVDPLGGFRKAIEVLGRLAPEADPWRRHHRSGTYEDLLHEMFEVMCGVVLTGLVLTQVSRTRPVTAEESNVLEEEEMFLQSMLEQWGPFFSLPQSRPEIEIEFVNPHTSEGVSLDDVPEHPVGFEDKELTSDEQGLCDEAHLHSTIAANLERMQADLGELLVRWRSSMRNQPEFDDEDESKES